MVRFLFCLLAALASSLVQAEKLKKLPEIDGQLVLASVNGESITASEFLERLGSIHSSADMGEATPAQQNPVALLERMINIRLVTQEASLIGLNESPEFKTALESFRSETLRNMLYNAQLEGISAEEEQVQTLYRETVKEVKLRSVRFDTEEDANAFEAAVLAGGDFDSLLSEFAEAGTIELPAESVYLKLSELIPPVAEALSEMEIGTVSSIISVKDNFILVKLEEIRFPDDERALWEAKSAILKDKRGAAHKKYKDELIRVNAVIDSAVYDTLDYEAAEPGFDALLQDQRILARVEGEAPVTVKELSEALESIFFHGLDRSIKLKKVNEKIPGTLNEILLKRIVDQQVKRQQIDQSEEFAAKLEEHSSGVLFGMFVNRVIDGRISLTEGDLRTYMTDHIEEYTSPEMITFNGLAFGDEQAARNTLTKLQQGADFRWMRSNAEGRVVLEDDAGIASIEGKTLMVTQLPAELQAAVAGAATGDYRLFAESDDVFYVLQVKQMTPKSPLPFESVRSKIAEILFLEKRQASLHDWERRLRQASEVETYATEEHLYILIRTSMQQGSEGGTNRPGDRRGEDRSLSVRHLVYNMSTEQAWRLCH